MIRLKDLLWPGAQNAPAAAATVPAPGPTLSPEAAEPAKAKPARVKPASSDSAEPRAPDPSETTIWSTKGIDFWAFLSAVLLKARPDSLLELGSGRSTTFLADYAYRHRKTLVSIEHSDVWHRKALADLKFMDVKGRHVHHVPMAKSGNGERAWYDVERTKRLIDGRAFDLVFVDGPVGESRRNAAGQAIVAEAARAARIVIVDDVQRPYNQASFEALTQRFPKDGLFYYRYSSNVIAIGTNEFQPIIRSAFEFLGLAYTTVAPPEAQADDRV
jgi:predicted O-methyltransferase YrrM